MMLEGPEERKMGLFCNRKELIERESWKKVEVTIVYSDYSHDMWNNSLSLRSKNSDMRLMVSKFQVKHE